MRIEVTPADVAASRYAISPLGEAVSALRLCAGQNAAAALTPWVTRARPAYQRLRRESPAVGALLALLRHGGYNADFTQPPPDVAGREFADELAVVRATPLAQARSELARNLAGPRSTPPAYARAIYRSPDVVDLLADAIEAAWVTLVEPDWPRLRAILERDLLHRAGRLVAYGWGRPSRTWTPVAMGARRGGRGDRGLSRRLARLPARRSGNALRPHRLRHHDHLYRPALAVRRRLPGLRGGGAAGSARSHPARGRPGPAGGARSGGGATGIGRARHHQPARRPARAQPRWGRRPPRRCYATRGSSPGPAPDGRCSTGAPRSARHSPVSADRPGLG